MQVVVVGYRNHNCDFDCWVPPFFVSLCGISGTMKGGPQGGGFQGDPVLVLWALSKGHGVFRSRDLGRSSYAWAFQLLQK